MTSTKGWRSRTILTSALAVALLIFGMLIPWLSMSDGLESNTQTEQRQFRIAITAISWERDDCIIVDYYIKDLRNPNRQSGNAGMCEETFLSWDEDGNLHELQSQSLDLGIHHKRDGIAGWLGMQHNTKKTTCEVSVPAKSKEIAIRLELWAANLGKGLDRIVLTTRQVELPPKTKTSTEADRKRLEPSGDSRQINRWSGNGW
jgi:hypothetical protein